MDYNFNIGAMFIAIAFFCFGIWGLWEIIDWLFVADVIESTNIITPKIELIIKDNQIDTLYIYKSN